MNGPRSLIDVRRHDCARPEKARAHWVDSESSSAPWAPIGVTTWDWTVAGSTACQTWSSPSTVSRLRRTSSSKAALESASPVTRGSSALMPPEATTIS